MSLLSIALIAPSVQSGGADGALPAATGAPATGDRIVVGFHGAIPADAESWIASLGGTVVLRDETLGFVAARFDDAKGGSGLVSAAASRADVRYAEVDGIVAVLATPNDPLYGQQWGYPAIYAPQAWDVQKGSHAVKVSILDTGIMTTHVDLAANACGPFTSFVPWEPTINDYHSHGTHVSGTVAAVSGNGVGVAGTSQSCLMGAKVLSAGGWGYWSWIASGIRWSADNGAHIISMSLGGGDSGTEVHDAVKYAVGKDVLVIAAAGNSGCSNPNGEGTVIWPARYPEVVAVAALRSSTALAGFSSCGKQVEIAAPGENVLSTLPWGYGSYSGTSMAAPHVAGVAALYKAHRPDATANDLRCLLRLNADDLGEAGRDGRSGFGRTNAAKLMVPGVALAGTGPVGTVQALSECLATLNKI